MAGQCPSRLPRQRNSASFDRRRVVRFSSYIAASLPSAVPAAKYIPRQRTALLLRERSRPSQRPSVFVGILPIIARPHAVDMRC
jgi:hypothetical protein